MRERASAFVRWMLAHVELRTVMPLLLVGCLAWAFAELADEVVDDETHAFDRAILLAMREPGDPADPLGPPWMHEVGRDVTALGGITILGLLTASILGYLWMRGLHRLGWALLAGISGAGIFTQSLKALFGRPRPDLVPYMTEVHSAAFPSGHASMSAATYLVLGMILARAHRRRALRAYIVSVCVVLTLLVGISRVYIGVHWPTDVLAGWTLGGLWATCVWTAVRWFENRAPLESAA